MIPLKTAFISRNMFCISETDTGYAIYPGFTHKNDGSYAIDPKTKQQVVIDGEPLKQPITILKKRLDNGVAILIDNAVTLLFHTIDINSLPLTFKSKNSTDSDKASILTANWKMARMKADIQNIASTSETVLLQGETGTGKELVAKALHRLSHRSTNKFVATIYC